MYRSILATLLASTIVIQITMAAEPTIVERTTDKPAAGSEMPMTVQQVSDRLYELGAQKVLILDGELSYVNLNSSRFDDRRVNLLQGHSNLVYLSLTKTRISDAALDVVGQLKSLRWLLLSQTDITDAGVAKLSALSNLQTLTLRSTRISDQALESVSHLPSLRTLVIGDTNISDAGIQSLVAMKHLSILHLEGTKITESGLQRLRREMPQCEIIGTSTIDGQTAAEVPNHG